jgi:glycosyltransferase involved in cell wall biosynthesis
VESLFAQTLARDRFEILVVKNYADDDIDRFLTERGVQQWATTARPLAEKLLEALGRSRGQVIAFLEDDDLYRPERLAAVESAFQEDPSLGFFRNGFDVMDQEGRPFGGPLSEAVRTSQESARDLIVRDADKETYHRTLVDALPDFNTSTMAIRRDLLTAVAGPLRRVERGVDRFLFYTAMAAPCTVRLDRRRLTVFRVHPENTGVVGRGGAEMLARLDRILAYDRADEAVIYELVRNSNRRAARREVEGRRVVTEALHLLRRPSVGRREMVRLLRQFPQYRDTQSVRVNHRLALECAAYVVSPRAAGRFYLERLNRRVGFEGASPRPP